MRRTYILFCYLAFVLMATTFSGCTIFNGGSTSVRYEGYRPSVDNVADNAVVEDNGGGVVDKPASTDAATRKTLNDGDPVSVTVRNAVEERITEDVIDGKGMISLPFIPEIKLAGLTPSQAEKAISDAYVKGEIYKRVVVAVRKIGDLPPAETFYIGGPVGRPGRLPYTEGMTLNQAILAAGDFSDWANPKKVVLVHDGKRTTHDVYRIRKGKDDDPVVESGDTIHVDERGWD